MTQVDDYFGVDYGDARSRFLQRATAAGFALREHVHALQRGPAGETLATDVARYGPRDAPVTLLVSSGTHGVEGFCGSGCQNALLDSKLLRTWPADIAIVLVHAINPFGFAHLRRVNEDNVDCNRNFVRHGKLPFNKAYDEVHPWLVPADWEGPAKRAADEAMYRFIAERGQRAFQAAVSEGQYDHADGLFYGGTAPVWSNGTWRGIVRDEAGGSAEVIAIDLHTGLGPSGVGEAIFSGPEADYAVAKALFGDDVTSLSAGTSASAIVGGTVVDGAREELGSSRLSMVTLEYGTRPLAAVLEALRADNWLHVHGQVGSPLGQRIKAAIRDAFYVDEREWKEAVVRRFLSLVARVLEKQASVLV
jgi:hypothetical protein